MHNTGTGKDGEATRAFQPAAAAAPSDSQPEKADSSKRPRATAKAKSKAKSKPQDLLTNADEGQGGAELPAPPTKRRRSADGVTATFARRYVPKAPAKKDQWNAMKLVFENHIKPRVQRASSLEDKLRQVSPNT